MYGTVNQIFENLKHDYPKDEKIMVIVWTVDDVLDVLRNENITYAMAARILAGADGMEGQHEAGIGLDTLLCIREDLEEEDGWRRQSDHAQRHISLRATELDAVTTLAEALLRHIEAECGQGAGRRLYPQEMDAVQRVRSTLDE